jgi:putative sigma-54 modulation protein
METTIESPHFTLSQELTDYITSKTIKLEHLNERLIRSEVCLKLDKSSTDDNKICEIRLVGPQKNLFASHRALTFEDAVTETIHALEKQLRKVKTKKEKGREKIEVEDDSSEDTNE